MAGVLIDCPVHGFVEAGGVIEVTGSGMVVFESSTATCPSCGTISPIVDGSYTSDRAGRVRANLRLTPAQARRLMTGVLWAQQRIEEQPDAEPEVREKIDRLVEREAPWLKQFIDTLLSTRAGRLVEILGFIMVVLTFFGCTPNGQEPQQQVVVISDDQLRELFDDYVGQGTGTSTPPPRDPTPAAPTPRKSATTSD